MKLSLESFRAVSDAVERARAWRWSKPLARALLAVLALTVFSLIGRATLTRASAASPAAASVDPPSLSVSAPSPEPASAPPAVAAAPADSSVAAAAPTEGSPPAAHGPATPEDPVVLNVATIDDLQRLPGVGMKRAQAILELRSRMGKFRQVEDLLKVRGIGLKTLRRLRPLVRLDPPPPPPVTDGG